MSMPSDDLLAQPLGASGYSRFVQRIRRRYADELALLPPGAPERAGMQITYDALQARGLDTGAALRVLRQLVMERLVVLDCDMAPTLVASRTTLPPGGADFPWDGPAENPLAPTLVASRAFGVALSLSRQKGALRLRPRLVKRESPRWALRVLRCRTRVPEDLHLRSSRDGRGSDGS